MSDVLERIVAQTRAEVARRQARVTLAELAQAARGAGEPRPFAAALRATEGIALIAEHKRRSPSAGTIREEVALEDVVGAYERGGAAALSILTEGPSFGGSLDDLRAARAASSLPLLRKDFIVERYQLHESRAAGADAILLIVSALGAGELRELHSETLSLGLEPLVEVHDRAELSQAVELGARLIGVNNRDLRDLSVDVSRTRELASEVPPGTTVVSESGFSQRAQLDDLAALGVHAVLIGEALMRAPDSEAAVAALTAAPGARR